MCFYYAEDQDQIFTISVKGKHYLINSPKIFEILFVLFVSYLFFNFVLLCNEESY